MMRVLLWWWLWNTIAVVRGHLFDQLTQSTKEWFKESGMKDQMGSAVEWIGFHSGLGEQCSFVQTPVASVRHMLHSNLRGQTRALEAVVSSIESWEFSRTRAQDRTPLILALTGPTGTGKTETSNLIAEGLFKHKKRLSNSDKLVSTGLLVFRGEDFNDNYTNPISQYHEQIKNRLAEHLIRCSGKALVVFDEVQKVIPHTLDVLMEAVSSRPQLTYYRNGVSKTIDCSNVIFILVSDIGADRMQKIILAHGSRDLFPQAELVTAVKDALDMQWKRLQFGKMVNEVIPFLPLEAVHIAEIIALKFSQMDVSYRNKYWKKLIIRDGVSKLLAQTRYVKYLKHEATIHGQLRTRVYAKYGARNVESSGPLQRLKSKLFRYVQPWNIDADVVISVSDPDTLELQIESCTTSLTETQLGCVTKWKGTL